MGHQPKAVSSIVQRVTNPCAGTLTANCQVARIKQHHTVTGIRGVRSWMLLIRPSAAHHSSQHVVRQCDRTARDRMLMVNSNLAHADLGAPKMIFLGPLRAKPLASDGHRTPRDCIAHAVFLRAWTHSRPSYDQLTGHSKGISEWQNIQQHSDVRWNKDSAVRKLQSPRQAVCLLLSRGLRREMVSHLVLLNLHSLNFADEYVGVRWAALRSRIWHRLSLPPL